MAGGDAADVGEGAFAGAARNRRGGVFDRETESSAFEASLIARFQSRHLRCQGAFAAECISRLAASVCGESIVRLLSDLSRSFAAPRTRNSLVACLSKSGCLGAAEDRGTRLWKAKRRTKNAGASGAPAATEMINTVRGSPRFSWPEGRAGAPCSPCRSFASHSSATTGSVGASIRRTPTLSIRCRSMSMMSISNSPTMNFSPSRGRRSRCCMMKPARV
jgi:hypothetical protein